MRPDDLAHASPAAAATSRNPIVRISNVTAIENRRKTTQSVTLDGGIIETGGHLVSRPSDRDGLLCHGC